VWDWGNPNNFEKQRGLIPLTYCQQGIVSLPVILWLNILTFQSSLDV